MLFTCRMCGVLLVGAFVTVQAASVDDLFEVSKTKLLFHLSNQQFSEAITYARTLESEFDASAYETEWDYWLAISEFRGGNIARAVSGFETLDEAGFEHQRFQYEYGLALLKQKNYSKSLAQLSQWRDDNPDNTDVHYFVALNHFELQQYKSAEEELNAYFNKQTTGFMKYEDQALYMLSATQVKLGNYRDAEINARSILSMEPESPYADAAGDLIRNIDALEAQQKDYILTADLTVAADSNVRLANAGNELDARVAFQASGKYQKLNWFVPEYQFFISQHQTANDYNLLSHQLTLSTRFEAFSRNVATAYQFGSNSLDGELWLTKHTVSFDVPMDAYQIGLDVSYNVYENSNNLLTALNVDVPNITKVMDATVDVYADVFTQLNDDFALEQTGIGAGASALRNMGSWQVSPGLDTSFRWFSPEDNREQSFEIAGNLEVKRRFANGFSSSAKLDGFLNISEPEAAGFNRWVASVVIGWRN